MKAQFSIPVVAALFFSWPLASRAVTPAGAGDVLPTISLADQFGKPQSLGDDIQRIYFDSDRKGDQLLKSALAERGQVLLDGHHAIVISDISGVPSFIKGFVISDLKDRHYRLWLDQQGSTTATLPRHANQVTVIELDQRRITTIRYCESVDQLKQDLTP